MTLMAKVPAPKIKARALEEIRISRGLTRRMLAEKAGTKYKTVYNLEYGCNPRIGRELLQRLAAALDVATSELAEDVAA